MVVLASFAATLLFACNTIASSNFTNPPAAGRVGAYQANPRWNLGDQVTVTWNTNIARTDILIWQDYPPFPEQDLSLYKKIDVNDPATSFEWTVNLDGLNSTIPSGEYAVLYFTLHSFNQPSVNATSHYVNVTKAEAAISTGSSAITSAYETSFAPKPTVTTSSSTASDLVLQPSGAATTPAPQPTGPGSGGLSTGAVAGIAVGSTIGGLALLVGLGFLFWKRNVRNKGHSEHQASPPPPKSQFEGRDAPTVHEADGSITQHPPLYEAP